MIRPGNIWRQLRGADDGVAMVEFAMVAPVMAFMIVSGLELANFALTHMRVSEIANTVADNAGRVTSGMDEANVYEIFAGAGVIGQSIDFENNGRVVLSSLQENDNKGNGKGQKIEWQRCWGELAVDPAYGTQGDGRSDSSLANGLGKAGHRITSVAGTAVMFAEVSFQYEPLFFDGVVQRQLIRYEAALNVRDRNNRGISNAQSLAEMEC
ncbi:MAG: TadE family protein [Erythrobacter sp.]|jgi:hypothetical protein